MKNSLNLLVLSMLLVCPSTLRGQQESPRSINSLTADHLFENTRVVDIRVDLPASDWDTIRKQQRSFFNALGRTKTESPFEYVKANVTIDGVLIEDVGIRKKGFLGSLDNQRPSLKIKFSEYKPQSLIDGLDRLTLNNNKQDDSRICQYLAYKLFNQSGTIAPRCGFAKLTVNGKYLGIYSNVELVKTPFLKRGFGDGSGALFEGTVVDFFPGWIQRFEKKNEQADFELIKQIAEILAAEELNLDQLGQIIDLDAFIRFWATESLIGFWDGYCNNQNNYFVYRNPGNSLCYFIPWGIDAAFSPTMPLPPYQIRPRSVHSQSILANKLYRVPEIQQKYQARLMSLLNEHWNETELLAEIDRVEEMISSHVLEQNRGFESTLKKYRRFVKTRRKQIMKEFEDGPPELKTREKLPIYFSEIGSVTASFSTHWYDKTPSKTEGIGEVDVQLEIDGHPIELEKLGVYAETSKWPSPDEVKPASIVIVGKRKSDGLKITLGTGIPAEQFQASEDAIEMGGVLIEGRNFLDPSKMKFMGGVTTLKQASMNKGQPVEGTMRLKIIQMQGGSHAKESGQ